MHSYSETFDKTVRVLAICGVGVFGTSGAGVADTVKRTMIPAGAAINQTARTLPADLRDPYYVGMMNLIFTLQPAHGDNAVAVINRRYSIAQIVEIGRGVQTGAGN